MALEEMSKEWLVREAERLQKMVERQELELQAAALMLAGERERNPQYKPPEGNSPDFCRSEFREVANNCNRFSGEGLYSWTGESRVFVPDVEYVKLDAEHTTRSLRGYAHVRAVMLAGECVGWIKEENVTVRFGGRFKVEGAISGRLSSTGPNISAPPRSEMEVKESSKVVRVDTELHSRLGLVRMEQTELMKCNSCGRVGMTVEETRDDGRFIICKCGEELEVVDEE